MIIKNIFKFLLAIIIWALELVARFIWLMAPIGLHMLFLQLRPKADKLPALTGYFDPDSTWQMIYDGAVLVNTNPNALQNRVKKVRAWLIETRWYWLIAAIGTALLLLAYIAHKLY